MSVAFGKAPVGSHCLLAMLLKLPGSSLAVSRLGSSSRGKPKEGVLALAVDAESQGDGAASRLYIHVPPLSIHPTAAGQLPWWA